MIQEGWAIVKQAAEWYFSNGYFFYLLYSVSGHWNMLLSYVRAGRK